MDKAAVLQLLQRDIKLSRHDRRAILQKFARYGSPLRRALDKAAALGGDPDQGFEQSFASLAYAHIQDKAPGLLDYLVGFQLVDRNNDNTKAVGVFGFKLSNSWLYIPVFFMSGDLKGHELLYLKQQRAFVPLKENWVNYIVNRRPQVLGEGTGETMQELGMRSPNLASIVLPPNAAGKYASERWTKNSGVLNDLAELASSLPAALALEKLARENESPLGYDLRQFVENYPQVLPTLVQMCDAWPGVKQAMDGHYGPDFLTRALSSVRDTLRGNIEKEARFNVLDRPPPAPPVAPLVKLATRLKLSAADEPKVMAVSAVKVITENTPEHTPEERKKLLDDGMLIKDERAAEEVSVAYDTQIPVQLCNPTETGVYQVLVKPGEFVRCLVIMAPYSDQGRKNLCTVVPLGEANKSPINIHESHVYIKQEMEHDSDILTWFKDLPNSDSLEQGGLYVAVSANGSGTCPFECADAGEHDKDVRKVYWQAWGKDYAGDNSYSHTNIGTPTGCCPSSCTPVVVLNTRAGDSFLQTKHERLYIPKNAKIIRVGDAPVCRKCDKKMDSCTCDYFSSGPSSRPEAIVPGDLSDLHMQLSTKLASLKIVVDGAEVYIGGSRFTKRAALLSLVQAHHFREGVARTMLKQAEQRNGARFWVKYAAPMGMPFDQPSAAGEGFSSTLPLDQPPMEGSMPYLSAPVEYGMEASQAVPELDSSMTDPNIYNPMMNMEPEGPQTAQSAQGGKRKQVFDTSMITALTKAVRPLAVTDRDTSALMKALNKLGQMLFMFYWHNEEYSDRYGKKDLPELEDAIRNSFESLGDLILFIKSKSAEPETDSFFNAGANIEATANN